MIWKYDGYEIYLKILFSSKKIPKKSQTSLKPDVICEMYSKKKQNTGKEIWPKLSRKITYGYKSHKILEYFTSSNVIKAWCSSQKFITVDTDFPCLLTEFKYRSRTVNSNTVNSKFHLIRSLLEILATILSFHV